MTVKMLRPLERRGAGTLELGLIGTASSDSLFKDTFCHTSRRMRRNSFALGLREKCKVKNLYRSSFYFDLSCSQDSTSRAVRASSFIFSLVFFLML
jgi:hypothetical protein